MLTPGLRTPFLLRRIASAWPLLASLMLTVFIAAGLLAALATFNAQVLPQAARRQLASSAQTGMAVSGPVDATVARADMRAVGAAIRGAFGPVPYRLNSAVWSDPLVLSGAAGSRVIRLLEAGAPGQFTAHARLVSGAWPGPSRPGRPVQAALPASVTAQLGASVGDVFSVQDRNNGHQARLQISGTFARRDPGSPYWGLDIVGPSGVSVSPGYITYGLIVSPAAFSGRRPALAVGGASWAAALDTQRIQASQIPGLASRVSGAVGYLQGTVRLGRLQVTSGLSRLLDGLTRSLAVARSMLAISALQLLLLAAAALVLAGRLLTSHRDMETALLGSRGAGGWQLARITLAEIAVVGGLGAAAGALASLLAGAGSLRDTAGSGSGVADASLWWFWGFSVRAGAWRGMPRAGSGTSSQGKGCKVNHQPMNHQPVNRQPRSDHVLTGVLHRAWAARRRVLVFGPGDRPGLADRPRRGRARRLDVHRRQGRWWPVVAALVAAATLLTSAPPAQAAAHPRPAPGPVVHEPDGVTIHYYAHPVGPVPINATSADGYSHRGSEVYLVCPTYLNTHCAGFLDTLMGAGGLVIGIIGLLCEAKVIDCPGIWKKISKGTGKHTGLVTFENEGEYGGVVNPNYDLHDCIGAAPNASDGNDRAYLSHPSRCFGVSYQSWKYQQDGSKPIYRFVNRYAELTYGRTDVLTMLSKREGAYLYAKTATALPSGAYAHWSIYAVGTCNPCS